jgi:hypothetical protein
VLSWRLNAQFDAKIVEDIYEMRQCFEPRACYLAARDGTAEDLRDPAPFSPTGVDAMSRRRPGGGAR